MGTKLADTNSAPDDRFTWVPSREQLEAAAITRLARRLGCEDYASLHRVSVEEPDRFWRTVRDDLGVPFHRDWDAVLDSSQGIEWTTWFAGARLNLAEACVHRWARETPDADAVVWQSEDGQRRALDWAELSRHVTRLAEALSGLGIGKGDAVGIYLPMSPEVAIASHACAHIGAVQVPIFSGFAAPAIVSRLVDAGARAVLTADGSLRRGSVVAMKETLDEALASVPSVEHVVTWRRLGIETPARRRAETTTGTSSSTRRRGRFLRSRWRARPPTSSRTRPARRAGRRARCTSRAASCSRSRARPRTRPISGPETGCCSRPTWAGSWGPGPSSAPERSARRPSSWRAPRTGPPTGSGGWSSRSASRCSASHPRSFARSSRTASPPPTSRRSAPSPRPASPGTAARTTGSTSTCAAAATSRS